MAYALTTTLEEESLPKMDSLVNFYLDRLGQKLARKKINLDIAEMRKEYDKVIFRMTAFKLTPTTIKCNIWPTRT